MPNIGWVLVIAGAVFFLAKKASGPPSIRIPDSAVYGFDINFDVQKFLEQKGSGLANFAIGGFLGIGSDPASKVITNVARQANIKPQYLLAVLQREQGLVEGPRSKNPTTEQMDWATGYGVPDSGGRDYSQEGFTKQLQGAASTANAAKVGRGSYASASRMVGTVVNTNTGPVIPQTLVSAMMLIYTPHSGALALTKAIYDRNFPSLMKA